MRFRKSFSMSCLARCHRIASVQGKIGQLICSYVQLMMAGGVEQVLTVGGSEVGIGSDRVEQKCLVMLAA